MEEAPVQEKIVSRIIEHELKQSYLGYSLSVIVGRALPDVRDGLKPVHRRVLYAMYDMGMLHNKPFKKSARIVGEVLGKYHPHGDSPVYESLVRMTQDFALRYPLIKGQGNFGSIDGDNAAAMRYTEAKLNKLSEELLQDIEKETVKFVPNFDATLDEPSVLPAKVPNLLINGSTGIAVGMATNIPPHNLTEVCDATTTLIDDPETTVEQLMTHIKAPDFPTGGLILGTTGIISAYKTGKGRVVIRAKIEIEEKKNKQVIIVTEIPYAVNKSQLIQDIAQLVQDKKIQGISDLRDESDRDGLRVVIELKNGANSDVVLNQLYQHTRLQDTYGITFLAVVNNQPKVLTLKEMLAEFIKHRQEIVRKRTQFDLTKAEDRAHILEGLIIALNHIDEVIKLIKASKTADLAKTELMKDYKLTDKQALAILEMTLRRLTNLEQDNIRREHAELTVLIKDLKDILASEKRILAIIKAELQEIKEKYGDQRKSQIIDADVGNIDYEQLIKPEEMAITISHAGYVKRLPVDTYKQQRRGGKGIIAAETKEEDFIERIFTANTHDTILFFTNKGKVHWIKVYQLPEAGRYAKGSAIVNLLQLQAEEKVTASICVKTFEEGKYLFMVTSNGTVKKTPLTEFSNPRKGGIIALGLAENDELAYVMLTDGKQQIIIATREGRAAKFHEDDVRPMGRSATGVRGITLRNDYVIGATIADDNRTLLTITEKGYGKRTQISEYRLITRGGVGVTNINITDKNGKVVGIASVDKEDLMLISHKGVLIRTTTNDISIIGRNTQGVRVMRLDDDDTLINLTTLPPEEPDE